jgi:hypothetical protein
LLQPIDVAIYVFLMMLLAPAAIAYSLMASYDSEINASALRFYDRWNTYVPAAPCQKR